MITPVDIQTKKYSSSAMGYKKAEVDEFMELLLRDYETMYKNNIDLSDKVNMLNKALEHYKSIEDTMQNALLVAQSTGDDMRRNAEDKARLIIETAEKKARDIIAEATRTSAEAAKDAETVRRSTEIFKAQMIGMFTSQIDVLKNEHKAKEPISKVTFTPVEEPIAPKAEPIVSAEETIAFKADSEEIEVETAPTFEEIAGDTIRFSVSDEE